MKYRFLNLAALMSLSVAAFGQAPGGSAVAPANLGALGDTGFYVRYAANLLVGDSVINITNTGASSTAGGNITDPLNGNLCANFYAYTPDEQLVACCSCEVTPNGLKSLSVKNDLASNPLTPIIPSDMVIKILVTGASATTSGGSTCTNASAATAGLAGTAGGNALAQGLVAWGTTIHALPVTAGTPATTYGVTETEFHTSVLSQTERDRMTQLCGFIRANGSGYGICKSCRLGGLGAAAK